MLMLLGLGGELMAAKPGDTVNLFIDSPGGFANVGTLISDKIVEMQNQKIRFRCVALRAYSAAFMIWSACQERLILAYGKVMFHYPYTITNQPLRTADLEEMARDMRALDLDYSARFNKALFPFVSPEAVEKAARDERMFLGIDFCRKFAKGACEVLYRYEYLEDRP